MKQQNKMKYPLKLRMLSCVPAAVSMIVMIAFLVPILFWAVPKGSLLSIVDGGSMDVTLHDGQWMFQDGRDFSRGDIVICTIPETEGSEKTKILVKRIVGMPGDSVRIDPNGVYINGQKLDEDYLTPAAIAGTYRETLRNDTQLSTSEYFLMGDNRGISYDSRFFGAIDQSAMLYKVSTKPGMPFFLAIGKVLLLAGVAFVLNFFVDDLVAKLLCKRNPELKQLLLEQADKPHKRKTESEQQ